MNKTKETRKLIENVESIFENKQLLKEDMAGFYAYLLGSLEGLIETMAWNKKLPNDVAKKIIFIYENGIKRYNPSEIGKENTMRFVDELKKYV